MGSWLDTGVQQGALSGTTEAGGLGMAWLGAKIRNILSTCWGRSFRFRSCWIVTC
jgi:hypothetical protein